MVPEITFKDHSRSSAMPSVVRSPGLSETGKVGYTYFFKDKIAEMALKIDHGDAQWHNSIGHISLSSSSL